MNNMMVSEKLFDCLDQQYTDVSVLMNVLVEEVYSTQEGKNELDASDTDAKDPNIKLTLEEMIMRVQGGENLHKGVLRTWNDLNKYFAGHGISFKFIEEWIAPCPVCQKDFLLWSIL
jgi:hypothetical protein